MVLLLSESEDKQQREMMSDADPLTNDSDFKQTEMISDAEATAACAVQSNLSNSSEFASFISDITQQTQSAMEALLLQLSDIDAVSVELSEDVKRTKDAALQRKANLEEERERFQHAACKVLAMLSGPLKGNMSTIDARNEVAQGQEGEEDALQA